MRIGLYGGTFNPVHKGHRRVIDAVCEQFGLDRVFVIPSAVPPHKSVANLATVETRIDMLEYAFSDTTKYRVSDVEARRDGRSYTIDTIRFFKAKTCRSDALYLVMGLDAFIEINTWYQWQRIFDTSYSESLPVIVMTRPVGKPMTFSDTIKKIARYLGVHMPGYRWEKEKAAFIHSSKANVYLCKVPEMMESSTEIRQRIKQDDPWDAYVPGDVAAYIRKKGLYK